MTALQELTAACDYYQQRKAKMITLEYILIAGVNDGLDQIRPLAQLAKKLLEIGLRRGDRRFGRLDLGEEQLFLHR